MVGRKKDKGAGHRETTSYSYALVRSCSLCRGLAYAQTVASPAPPPPAPTSGTNVQLIPLRVMLEKGIITEAEYQSAVKDMLDTSGARGAAESTSLVYGKWSATLYGFVEPDMIYDSTQSFNDLAGAGLVARPGTYAGNNDRVQFSMRNSRIGFRFRAPEYHGIRASARIETDFLVNPTPIGYTGAAGTESENAFFTNPFMRIRHMYMKIENPIVDVLFGQTWHLFGWQDSYQPNTVQYQGVPGELYARTMQLRISKTAETKDFTFDVAVAAMRPPQRDSGTPEFEGGIHFAVNSWKATQTIGATGTTVSPLSLAVTGDLRRVSLPNFAAKPTYSNDRTSSAIAVDAFIPIIPATKERMGNSLSVQGEFVTGYGIADMYTGLSSGVANPALPAPAGGGAAPTYNPQIDPGIAVYDADGNLHFVQYTTYRIGLQYYLPGLNGKLFISGNYSHTQSSNAIDYGPAAGSLSSLDWWDVNLMGDLTPAVRLGVEYANYRTDYNDNTHASNDRVQVSGFYIF